MFWAVTVKVLNLTIQDCGGDSWRTWKAFDRYAPDWAYHAVTQKQNYIRYPIHRRWAAASRLARTVDVIHCHDGFNTIRMVNAMRKPIVIHYHGTKFRNNPVKYLTEMRAAKAVGLAATLDLWLLAPDELEWLPAPYDLGELDTLAASTPKFGDGLLRIGHAPTDRAIKSTDALINAVERLQREGLPVELVLIERRPWDECLSLKATCDVYFDQVILGYGNNAIEAWGMGIPVIAGAADATLGEYERRFGQVPFLQATETSIYDALTVLTDPTNRAHWATIGRNHVQAWHDDKKIVTQLQNVYRRAVGS